MIKTNTKASFLKNNDGLLLSLIVLCFGIWVQSKLFLNWDDDWLIHAAARLLSGGNYYNDFFEINMPMAIFVHLPAVLLAKYCHLNFIISFRIYFFTLIFLSLIISHSLLKIILPENFNLQKILILTLSFIYIILPADQFGQREHFLIIFTIPYILLLASRCE